MNERPGTHHGSFEELPVDEPYAGVSRRRFDSTNATVAAYRFEPGTSFPIHRHPQEQITLIEQGEVEFTTAGVQRRMHAGDWSVVPPDVEHGLRAGPQGARVLAVVVPRREQADAYTVVEERQGTPTVEP